MFVVAPASEGIVFELKNERENMGCLRNDADLIGQRLVGQIDKTALRSNNVTVAVITDETCDYEALASVCDGDAKTWSDGTSFAVQCKDVVSSKMDSLLGLATRLLLILMRYGFPRCRMTWVCNFLLRFPTSRMASWIPLTVPSN